MKKRKKKKTISDKEAGHEFDFASEIVDRIFSEFDSYQQRGEVLGAIVNLAYDQESDIAYEEGRRG